jgi:hypothetical protein
MRKNKDVTVDTTVPAVLEGLDPSVITDLRNAGYVISKSTIDKYLNVDGCLLDKDKITDIHSMICRSKEK